MPRAGPREAVAEGPGPADRAVDGVGPPEVPPSPETAHPEDSVAIAASTAAVIARFVITAARSAGQDVGEVEAHRLFKLPEAARGRVPVWPPADELRRVPESRALHMVVPDLDHALGA